MSNLLVLLLAQLVALSLASLAKPSRIAARSPLCANLPHAAAGAIPYRRDPHLNPAAPPSAPLDPRATSIVWCLENTTIYIILDMDVLPVGTTLGPTIQAALENATTTLLHRVETQGDGVVTSWVFRWPPSSDPSPHSLVLVGRTANTHERQLTWSALDGAFMAFWDYVQHEGVGFGQFGIYYEEWLVGRGALRQGRI
ncbi:MAG: hypothetical protein FRX48_01240 [Lasallia pustulata]|uniref:Uncharacterized protein n=1 Tax=Lasallia pustulata TaxID=136370 RepID=A0A5M8PXP1_9LECA|nr:MAG: hypothetical protein FRX48_01240 [Lasallia pustulata]